VRGRFAATGVRPRFYEKMLAMGHTLAAEVFDSVEEVEE
jgi:hypothetical protein